MQIFLDIAIPVLRKIRANIFKVQIMINEIEVPIFTATQTHITGIK